MPGGTLTRRVGERSENGRRSPLGLHPAGPRRVDRPRNPEFRAADRWFDNRPAALATFIVDARAGLRHITALAVMPPGGSPRCGERCRAVGRGDRLSVPKVRSEAPTYRLTGRRRGRIEPASARCDDTAGGCTRVSTTVRTSFSVATPLGDFGNMGRNLAWQLSNEPGRNGTGQPNRNGARDRKSSFVSRSSFCREVLGNASVRAVRNGSPRSRRPR